MVKKTHIYLGRWAGTLTRVAIELPIAFRSVRELEQFSIVEKLRSTWTRDFNALSTREHQRNFDPQGSPFVGPEFCGKSGEKSILTTNPLFSKLFPMASLRSTP